LEFKLEEPPINIGADISVRSFEMIEEELKDYKKADDFTSDQLEVISRLIHTTTCFDEVLDNIYFSNNAIAKIQGLMQAKAKIIVDVNMIKVGLSDFYLQKYETDVVCYIKEKFTYERAEKNKTTRSYAAVVEAIKRHKDEPMILACGNAPTFIYGLLIL
jgi:precorrin-8X/cobalt-precorrin-8 methylmutase